MKKIVKINAACALVALHHVSGVDETTVLRVCAFHGFEPGQGMEDEDWKAAAADLGVKMRAVPLKPCRLKKFMKDNPTGLFLLGTTDHLFALDNGVLIDPRWKASGVDPGRNRIIKQAWKVL